MQLIRGTFCRSTRQVKGEAVPTFLTFIRMKGLEIKDYEIFKQKLGEAEAATILEFIEEKAEAKINSKKDVFLTKEDKPT